MYGNVDLIIRFSISGLTLKIAIQTCELVKPTLWLLVVLLVN